MEDIVVPKEMKEYIKVYEKYYKLKNDYEEKKKKKKKNIMKASDIPMEKKIFKIKNIKMNCIQCGKGGGTKFFNEDRVLYARCNADVPCDLNIELNISKTYFLPKNLKENVDYLNELKKQIIITKLNYLFDLEKDDITSQKFKVKKEEFVTVEKQAETIKKLLEQQLSLTEIENEDGSSGYSYKKNLIKEKTKTLNAHLHEMQKVFNSYKADPDKFSLVDATTIYKNNVLPLLENMRKIKYDIMYMDSEQYTDDFVGSKEKNVLKQIENGIQSYCHIEEAGQIVQDKVSAPVKKKRKRKRKKIIINKRPDEGKKEAEKDDEESDEGKKEEEEGKKEEDESPPHEYGRDIEKTLYRPPEAKDETPDGTPEKEAKKLSDLDELDEFDPEIDS